MAQTSLGAFGLPPTLSLATPAHLAEATKHSTARATTDVTCAPQRCGTSSRRVGAGGGMAGVHSGRFHVDGTGAAGLPSTSCLLPPPRALADSGDAAAAGPTARPPGRPNSTRCVWRASSISSSEFFGRVEALELQLEEERRRRLEVERRIRRAAASPNADAALAGTAPPLRADALAEIQSGEPSSAASAAPAASTRGRSDMRNVRDYVATYAPPSGEAPGADSMRSGKAAIGRPPAPPARGVEVAPFVPEWLRRRGPDKLRFAVQEGPERKKPPLPPVARGVRSSRGVRSFGRRRVPSLELYVAERRHEQRMENLAAFEAMMMGGGA